MVVSCKNGAGERRSVIPARKVEDASTVVGTIAGLVDMVALGLVPLNDGDDGHVVFVAPETKRRLAKILGASFDAAFHEEVGVPARTRGASAQAAPARAPARDKRVDRELTSARRITSARIRQDLRYEERQFEKARAARDRKTMLFRLGNMARPVRWRGERAIANGDPAGWKDMLDSCWTCLRTYELLGVRSLYAAGNVAPALLLVLGVGGWSKGLTRVTRGLDAVLARTRGADRAEAHVAYFASFCAELLARGRAKPRGPKGALYQLSEHALGTLAPRALTDTCAFQLKNGGTTEADDVELAGYELIPVWWFALAKARAARGLVTPRPNHALFTTPFATLPEPLAYDPAQNPLLARLARL
jgi:hypothetical protein